MCEVKSNMLYIMQTAILYLLLIVAIGAEGLAALSQITGLEISSGRYDFQKDKTMIYAHGRSPAGLKWKVTVSWRLGRPEWILFEDMEVEL